MGEPSSAHPGPREYASAFVIWYLRAATVVNLLGAVWISFGRDLKRHNDGDFFTPHLVAPGFTGALFVAVLAVTMRRRKRAAWILNLAMGALVLALYTAVMATFPELRAHAFDWLSWSLTALFVLCLLVGRREFPAKGDRANPRLALAVAFGGLLVTTALATLLVTVTNQSPVDARSDLGSRLAYAVGRLVFIAGTEDRADGIAIPGWVDVFINVMAALLLLLVLLAAFRSRRATQPMTAEDEERLRLLLERHGERDSLGYFALRRDKSVIWSPTGKAAVTYRVLGGVSLASADPIGDPEAWPGAIDAWLTEAEEHAWAPAVMGAGEIAGTIYSRHGLAALELGDEAIVETADFTLEGRAIRAVRQAYNRVRRAGYQARIRRHQDIPPAEMARLMRRAEQWRDSETERGFSMALGRLGDPADGRCVMVECRDSQGALRALLSFVPWGREGLSLDLMRRDREAENGLMEFAVLELIRRAHEVSVTQISLNFAMFRSVFERGAQLGAGPVLRLWRSLLSFFSRWWQIESLYRANVKYRPVWEPRFILFAKSSELPRIGFAGAVAEGFLDIPVVSRCMRRTR
ncbi:MULTISPECIES: phosphatidylglycerol lysyltransferase domain-containing protein [unclassified Streptomyces]|uniref:phosphatidylglycerol lysyltransferase domain-containing protein n=1 Tax=unclassified Streptomyces TaxID=2593676 RepID=UPI002DD9E5C4|nr:MULTISPECIES: phosphatidylglycerol lysyltransferase domain-containing protein [unclassified Streptomyces]WSA95231.1 phosphatidylglycerol lysyltransferase domain-containing protein [Streptomyces sp. NBC_01795]WSB79649.1 phosphatidylglycerol lysyltransferase domain-containing protein [Streptomyces sp. NBC_01775]WSS12148.1 phosphatidylglycerol lysyltransferase domain-containing protein [Streptomyces sp. NBC_01186]WSS40859.1 phosphatidylglycerol lysyltransferase domain-containing protein [Strept